MRLNGWMEPIRTARFVMRPLRLDDAPTLATYRSDPSTAAMQSWSVPYPVERAAQMIATMIAMKGPEDGAWYALGIADPLTDELLGDVVARLEWNGRAAEVGFTLAPGARGLGAATEGATAMVELLFESLGVQRIHAAIHPKNFPSAMVLERLGFTYEGTHRQAYWVGDECTDDVIFGLLRSDWEHWRARPRHRPTAVRLIDVDYENCEAVAALTTHWSQRRFVSPMARWFTNLLDTGVDDHGGPYIPWFQAVIADDELVGAVVLLDSTPTHPTPYLWRLLIDRHHQRRSVGTGVLDLITARCCRRGDRALRVQYGQGRGNPSALYLGYGFEPTGRLVGGEVEALLPLTTGESPGAGVD